MVDRAFALDIPGPPEGDPATTSRRNWTPRVVLSLVSLSLLLELLAISYIMVAIALPSIAAHYQTTQSAWLQTSFLLAGAVMSPLIGKLADTHGKRRLIMACMATAAVGSVLSAVGSTFFVVVAGRALTGMLSPCLFLVYTLIRDVFPRQVVSMAVSISVSGMGLVSIPAPFLTGWLVDSYGFRSIFWFTLACLVVLAVLIWATTPESPVRLRSKIDLAGAALLGAGIAGVLIAISFAPEWGWTAPKTLGYAGAGLVLFVAWAVSARVAREPLLDLRILANRPVALTTLSSGLCYSVSAVYMILLPFMCMTPAILGLGYGFGVSAEGFAVFQAPLGAATVIGGFAVGSMVHRVGPRTLMIVGMMIMAVASTATAFSHESKPEVIAFAALCGLGAGMGYAAAPNLLIATVPPALQATAGSVTSVSQNILPAALPVIAFSVLNSHIAMEIDGAALYSDEGMTIGFLIAAGVAVAAAATAWFLPRTLAPIAELDMLARPGEEALTPSRGRA